MKKLSLFLFLLAAAYIVYTVTGQKSPFDVRDRIIVSQASGFTNNAGNTPPLTYAHVEGVITNTAGENAAGILLVYTIGYDTVSANVGFLTAGDSSVFRTNTCRVGSRIPRYALQEVRVEGARRLSN